MKQAKELIYTNLLECPVPGCKRGVFEANISVVCHYMCPEHQKNFSAVLKDNEGKEYRLVYKFGDSKEPRI